MGKRYAWPLFYLVFFCVSSFILGGDASPDTRAYHIYIGYAAITGGRPQDIAVAGLQSYFCPVLDAWYGRLFSLLDDYPSQVEILFGVPYAAAASLVYLIGVDILPASWPWRKAMAGTAALFWRYRRRELFRDRHDDERNYPRSAAASGRRDLGACP